MATDRSDVLGGDPEDYGIQDLDAPGEPNRAAQAPSTPVPGVHKETRDRREGTPGSEGHGHTEGGGGRDHH